MQPTDLAELRRLWEETAEWTPHWSDTAKAIHAALPALLDELEAARAELEALKVPLAIYERHTKAIGVAEELELVAGEWSKRGRQRRFHAQELLERAAKLRQEAEDATR